VNQDQNPYGFIPPQQQPSKTHGCRKAALISLAAIGGLVILIIIIVVVASSGHDSSSSTPPAAATGTHAATGTTPAAKAAGPDKVCFAVTGTGTPTISYGNDNDSRDAGGQIGTGNKLPWHACMPANRDASFWNVTAQLQGGGDITATVTEVRPDGTRKVLQTAHASGGYQIALAEYVGYVGP
jgi:hypothetical protein